MRLIPHLPTASQARESITIGILALQGAFVEHQSALERLSVPIAINVVLVRTTDELDLCDALIIPGGESTTIIFLARLSGLLEPLRKFVRKKPVWGTCAGAILLAQSVVGAKKGGQELLGGMSITIGRNGWGSQARSSRPIPNNLFGVTEPFSFCVQVESFEVDLEVPVLRNPEEPFRGVFIRAPVVLDIQSDEEGIEVVARLPSDYRPRDGTETETIVALRQGEHLLTTFHPELTEDHRFHEYFVLGCVLKRISSSSQPTIELETISSYVRVKN